MERQTTLIPDGPKLVNSVQGATLKDVEWLFRSRDNDFGVKEQGGRLKRQARKHMTYYWSQLVTDGPIDIMRFKVDFIEVPAGIRLRGSPEATAKGEFRTYQAWKVSHKVDMITMALTGITH
jgi:hypothetical protein